MTNAIGVYRGDYLESTHEVHIAVVDQTGKLLYAYGDPYRPTFPRSSMKPFQAVPILETGTAAAFDFSLSDLALSCSSHSGEPVHRSAVLDILRRAKLKEEALQCGTHVPRDKESYVELIREGRELTPVYSNCSGKHAGMLSTAVHMKEDIDTYREAQHPVQQRILEVLSDVCSFPVSEIAFSVDGCGVPVHRIPLFRAAFGYARLASPDAIADPQRAGALRTICQAMTRHPEMVAGKNRFDTDVMRAFQGGVVSKTGAEGVQCLGIVNSGIGIAVKTEDGTARAASVAAMEVLKQLGIGDEGIYQQLETYIHTPVTNAHKEQIGVIKADFTLDRIH
ncbi:asparaginase [Paenibacillus physcomitrellae]|uniref:Asparaginase n=1 Tax=Paenibacillus physcomitrellae TaxID=1619311 RepID=A0ABQ1GJL3_9BACL|nr:asparaginase [Paenibacillus physcomitrellae]GGA45232.1 asparaginase [Paenibacillus physcomitrellae]